MANRKLNSIKFPDIADTYILDADKVNYDDSETYASGSVGKALQNKADNDGSYSNMTVGNAEQLVSNVRVNDQTPYLFRTSGGSVDIGDREYVNGIVGGTVAWNQLEINANMTTNNATKEYDSTTDTVTFTPTRYDTNATGGFRLLLNVGHKYYFVVDYYADYAVRARVGSGSGLSNAQILKDVPATTWTNVSGIISCVEGTSASAAVFYATTSTSGWTTGTFKIRKPQVFDLTQMFGSTIADYIYSLEQANAGAGVAWFKKLFNKPYYAYNAGELKSVSGVSAHNMTGFNQWDGEYESGDIDSATGNNSVNASYWRSKNYVPILPNTAYYPRYGSTLSTNFRARFYDADKNYIGYVDANGNQVDFSSVFTTPTNAHFIRFSPSTSVDPSTVCINLAWDGSRNGEYEPYELHSYPLDTDLTLRGIPKLDANNNLYYDGDVYAPSGEVTRKYGVVDLGTLTWGYDTTGTYPFFRSNDLMGTIKNVTANSVAGNMLCSRYRTTDANTPYAGNATNCICEVTFGQIQVYDTAYNDATAFKTAMNGVYLVYELATPTTETADAYQTPQIVNDFGTEEYVLSDSVFPVPVGHDTDYPINLVAKLEMAPNSPEGNGDYIVRQTNGTNEYVPLVIEDALPTIPSTAGTYKLTVTVAEGSDPVLSWEAE